MGEALDTVQMALTAARDGRLDAVGGFLAPEVDWQGLAGEDGVMPTCHGREQALQWMGQGLFARGEVAIGSLEEYGHRVLVSVIGSDAEDAPRDRFLIAEVHNGEITNLTAFAEEARAREALS